ncbi:septal ring lytic transglycosylase RlpA family protein [Sphingomonas sp. SUN019]|uniref:septal ring lytic transglycosylase RlpA family protein n=1 Tax=Sphingomonas sp. SUN019 TaxID=2937788 RepID=UPI0021646A27|nr:septal ring lytic transglycosylase RlpA family protein [Sphingomonas sp. SUN019]UVO49241.1 septal ring lytic transglycosylase RlpA family protein [Sphingomonas sp. SUN019]
MAPILLLASCGASSEAPRQLSTSAPPMRGAPTAPVPLPPEAGQVDGPSGTAGAGAESRYDEVGLATWYGEELSGSLTASGAPFRPTAITAAHRTLPLGSHAEVTALDTGRTILVLINDRGPGRRDRLIDLSRGAAELLGTGTNPKAPVRIRTVTATPEDAAAISAGRAATSRLATPPALLTALRRKLNGSDMPAPPPQQRASATKTSPPPPPRPAPRIEPAKPAREGHYLVQVAAFSTEARARALAKRLDGRVEGAGGVWRVRLGPFTDAAAARRARDGAARQGYGDAAIITQ